MHDEMDILKEVGGIAAAHGSIGLSEVIGRRITLEVPTISVITYEQVPKSLNLESIGVAIFSKIIVGLKGDMIFLMDEKNIFKLIDMSYKAKEESKTGVITELGLSFVKEIGNIVTGSYLNALSLMLKRVVLQPLPTLMSGSIKDILGMILTPYQNEEHSCVIESMFSEPEGKISGSFYLILDPQAIKDIREACKKLIETL